jgi:hypothetical protein
LTGGRKKKKLFWRKFKNYTEYDLKEFGIKFGENMKFISVKNFDNKKMKTLLRKTPNIERIDCNDQYFFGPNEKYFSKLQEIRFINTQPICTKSFKPGLSLKPGLKPENWFKSY